MRDMILFWLCAATLSAAETSAPAEDLETGAGEPIVITAGDAVLGEVWHQDSETWIDDAPAQTRLSVDEALATPGVFGDPVRAISYQPGVQTIDGQLSLHASKPDESQYTINHLPIGYLFHLGGLYSVLSSEAVAQMDLYLGAFDVTYGNATGGVVDITPHYPDGDGSGYVQLGLIQSAAGIDAGLGDNWALSVHGRRSYFDLLLPKAGEISDTLSYDKFPRFWDANVMLSHWRGGHQFSFEGLMARDGFAITTTQNEVRDPDAVGDVAGEWGFDTAGLRWRYDDGHYRANTLIGHMNAQLAFEFFDGYFLNYDYDLETLYHVSTVPVGTHHRLSAGCELQYFNAPITGRIKDFGNEDSVDFDFTTAPDIELDEHIRFPMAALFAQDHVALSDTLAMRAGLRAAYSTFGDYEAEAMPRGALIWTPNDIWTLSLATGRYARRADILLYLDEFGGETITDEHATHYSLSLRHANPMYGSIKVEPYYKVLSDLVIPDQQAGYLNRGSGEAYGVDLRYELHLDRFHFDASYTYERSARQLNTASDQEFRFYNETPHTLQGSLAWRITPTWSVSALARYTSGTPYTPVIGRYQVQNEDGSSRWRPIYGEPYSERAPAYFLLNLKGAYTRGFFGGDYLELALEIYNATNRRNVEDVSYDDNYERLEYDRGIGVIPTFNITYLF